jgi:hypothetical protein
LKNEKVVESEKVFILKDGQQEIYPTKEMLIGYKLKYIFNIGCSTWLKPCSTFEEYNSLLDFIIERAIKEIK